MVDHSVWEKLSHHECYWRDRYHWLLEQGYQLRPRYHPEWIPSWHKVPVQFIFHNEDFLPSARPNILDAIRLADNSHVVIKRVDLRPPSEELEIIRYFSEEPQRSDPRNHCVPLLDALFPSDDTDHAMVVLPILRLYDDPEFETLGEALDSIREIMEGLAFMHEHNVVHRDIRSDNYMLDSRGMYKQRFNHGQPEKTLDLSKPIHLFQRSQRTGLWPKYYIIDFGHSTKYAPEDMPPSEIPERATDNTAPEFAQSYVPSNPFPLDVFRFGRLIEMDFIKGENPSRSNPDFPGLKGFDFLAPLVSAMTVPKPEHRVTMHEAVDLFDKIVSKLSTTVLRSRVASYARSPAPKSEFRSRWRKVTYTVKRIPPMRPKRSPGRIN